MDFSQAIIFMTSNLGASEMSALVSPKLGFHAAKRGNPAEADDNLTSKMSKSGVEAARRKFTPEFMNRIDKISVFRPLGKSDLRCILDLELRHVQQRILHTTANTPLRHLKRTIERMLVHPMCNLIASNQVNAGDYIEVDLDDDEQKLSFAAIDYGLALRTMTNLIEDDMPMQATAAKAA